MIERRPNAIAHPLGRREPTYPPLLMFADRQVLAHPHLRLPSHLRLPVPFCAPRDAGPGPPAFRRSTLAPSAAPRCLVRMPED